MKSKYIFESVTSTVNLLVSEQGQGDGIAVHVVNDSNKKEQARVIIYHNTGAVQRWFWINRLSTLYRVGLGVLGTLLRILENTG